MAKPVLFEVCLVLKEGKILDLASLRNLAVLFAIEWLVRTNKKCQVKDNTSDTSRTVLGKCENSHSATNKPACSSMTSCKTSFPLLKSRF